jgi:hypothetical protein
VANTVKVRVVDNGETFAIDEVYIYPVIQVCPLTVAVLFLVLQQWPGRTQRPAYHGQ